MSTKVLGDVCYPTGSYTDQSGQEKKRWGKCGVLMMNSEGQYRLKLDMIPIGIPQDGGWFAVFPKENKPTQSTQEAKPQQQGFRETAPATDEDIPF